jgi:hypothetical protein
VLSVTETAVIAGRPEDVFAVAAEPQEQLRWDPGTLKSVEKITPGPLTKGSRYRGVFKGFGTVEYEFVEYDPPRRFAHLARVKVGRMRHVFAFEPAGEGTRMTQEAHLEPSVLGRLLGPMVRSMLRKRFRLIAREIGQYLAKRGAGRASG